ncbi:MAG: FeoB-associated Cys-rich membrane protein [Campylobacterales bacterium]|nr:FeoB-associated Cys-rich membrane protein [Campylobacterales bacterium]
MYEKIFLVVITIVAIYYIYKRLFKSGGCNCGDGGCKNKK